MWNSVVTSLQGDIIALLMKGGLTMIPLLGASLVSVMVIVERFFFWRRLRAHAVMEEMTDMMEERATRLELLLSKQED